MHRTIIFRNLCGAGRLVVPSVPELQRVAFGAIPCLILTPIDCFWEGSILQEPDADVTPVNTAACLRDSPSGYYDDGVTPANVTWGNLQMDVLRSCLSENVAESHYTPFIDKVCIVYTGLYLTVAGCILCYIEHRIC